MSFFSELFGLGSKTAELKELLSAGAIIIDVRSPEEFKGGHLHKSTNIPLQVLSQSINKLKGKTVITVCASGGRSGMAATMLQKEGINAINGGGWHGLQSIV
ncbi:rhodanese-like domain-containing protein [Limnovirga soli]|uniref:Rhodanese-like domain-containing protein n=1 Tax=Limnovirga soli TaxID=2656915 RepID=A0A8J8FFY2_9BACT|nr:rhodanese-like domain-containing protein [Limnovirga soli]NNV57178.1 rhodanese-like domain-containing protein [Limnovirga soli]